MADNEISVDVKINGLDESSKSINKFNTSLDDLQKTTNKSDQSSSGFTSTISTLSKGFGAFGLAVVGVRTALGIVLGAITPMIAAAAEQEDVVNRLNTQLAATGRYSKDVSLSLQEFASQLQRTTKFSDDQILSTSGLIASLTNLKGKGIEEATKAAADLSTALGIDLDSAARAISKSINGNNEALNRYGVKVKEGATESERLANTMSALSKFAGSSEAASKSFTGAVAKLSNQWGEFLEVLGNFIVKNPIVIKALDYTGKLFGWLTEKISNAGKAIFEFFGAEWEQSVEVVNNTEFKPEVDTKGLEEYKKKQNELRDDVVKLNRELQEYFDPFAKINNQYQDALSKVDAYFKGRKDGEEEYNLFLIDLTARRNQEFDKLFQEQQDKKYKAEEEQFKKINDLAAKNPIQAIIDFKDFKRTPKGEITFDGEVDSSVLSQKLVDSFTIAGSIFSNTVAKGAEGGRKLVVESLAAAGDAFFPGLGQAAKPFIDAFSQGPEAVKKMVTEFVQAIPKTLFAIVQSIPVFIKTFVDEIIKAIPQFIDFFAKEIPTIVNQFALQMPFIAFSLIEGIVKNIPYLVESMAAGLFNSVMDIFNKLNPFGGDDGGFLGIFSRGGIGRPLYAQKGFFDPRGTDTVPALYTPGEMVVDRSSTLQLKEFLNKQESQGGQLSNGLLAKVIDLLSRDQKVETQVMLNQKVLADIILNLSRTNARVTI